MEASDYDERYAALDFAKRYMYETGKASKTSVEELIQIAEQFRLFLHGVSPNKTKEE